MIIQGFCPTQNKDVQIEVEYKSYGAVETSKASAVKTIKKCDFAKTYGACTIECPLFEKAPNHI